MTVYDAASNLNVALSEGLAAGTFIYVGATEVSSDEFETTVGRCRLTLSNQS
jgi:hypothetical protein